MVNLTILEGLKLALSNGESLRAAMTTFYNAGYSKQEIEEAAEALNSGAVVQRPVQQQPPAQPNTVQQKPVAQQTKTPQRVSSYGQTQPGVRKNILPNIRKRPIQQQQPMQRRPMAQPIQRVSNYGQAQQPMKGQPLPMQQQPSAQPIQRVSNYGQPQQPMQQDPNLKSTRKIVLIVLAIVLFCLLGLLAFLFIFKESVLTFFDKLNIF